MSTETGIQILTNNLPTLKALMGLNARPGTDIETMVLQEIQYVEEHGFKTPAILQCAPQSILIAVRRAIKLNLTLDPDAKLMYLIPGSVKQGNSYVKVLEAPLTANGALSVAYQCGTILDHERPSVSYNEKGQCIKVTVKLLRPSVPSPRWETIEYDTVYFKKWMTASHKKNARTWNAQHSTKPQPDANTLNHANELYRSHNGSIDPEFAIAKALRHSLEKLGTNPNAKVMLNVSIPTEKRVTNEPEEEFTEAEEMTGTYSPSFIVSPPDAITANDL